MMRHEGKSAEDKTMNFTAKAQFGLSVAISTLWVAAFAAALAPIFTGPF